MSFWSLFISKVFGEAPRPDDKQYPLVATMRAQRRFEGMRREVPLEYLAEVELPTLTETELSRVSSYTSGRPLPYISINLPAVGAPTVPRAFAPELAAARELGVTYVKVRPYYT